MSLSARSGATVDYAAPMLAPPLLPTFEAALRDVTSKDGRLRALAAERLADPPEQGADPQTDRAQRALRPLVDDPEGPVRFAALVALGRLKDASMLDVILARFDDGDPNVRQAAVIAAAELGDARAVEPLRAALGHRHPEVRYQAVASFAELCPDQATSVLLPMQRDADPEVRLHLAMVLGDVDDPRAPGALSLLLEDDSPAVRAEAALGLAAHEDARGARELIALLSSDRALAAADALGRLGVKDAIEPLARLSRNVFAPLIVRAAVGGALARLGDPRGEATLRKVLRALRADGRSYALQIVGELKLGSLAADVARLVDANGRVARGIEPEVMRRALEALSTEPIARDALARTRSSR